jgi:hypothetical protein
MYTEASPHGVSSTVMHQHRPASLSCNLRGSSLRMAEKGELPLFQSTVPRESQQSRCSNPHPPNNPVGPLFIGKPPLNVAPKSCSNSSRRASTIHGSFQGHNAIPQCLSGRRRVTKLCGRGNLAFVFDRASLREAGRPIWSEKASQGLCDSEHSLLFYTDAWINDHRRDMSAQLIQRGEIFEIGRVD